MKVSYLQLSEDTESDEASLVFFSSFQENSLQYISLNIHETLT